MKYSAFYPSVAASVWQFGGVRRPASYRRWLLAFFVLHYALLCILLLLVFISVQLASRLPAAPGIALILAFPIQLCWGFLQWPLVAIQAQRWKDAGCSGWWALLHLLPLLGWGFAVYLLFKPTQSEL